MKPDTIHCLSQLKMDVEKNLMSIDQKIKKHIRAVNITSIDEYENKEDTKVLLLTYIELTELNALLDRVIKIDEISYKEKMKKAEQLIIYELYKKQTKDRKRIAFNTI